jgi:putative component of toxin-antitoxin plasmid stabilization module
VQYSVQFYSHSTGEKPVATFLAKLRAKHPDLYTLVNAGMKKLENRQYHKPPLTELVDRDNGIYELRVGRKNIARVFWFYQRGRVIIATNGYVKKTQKADTAEIQRACKYKKDWEVRTG